MKVSPDDFQTKYYRDSSSQGRFSVLGMPGVGSARFLSMLVVPLPFEVSLGVWFLTDSAPPTIFSVFSSL